MTTIMFYSRRINMIYMSLYPLYLLTLSELYDITQARPSSYYVVL
jgi:hypothetical protein